MILKKILIISNVHRFISSTTVNYRNHSLRKEAKFMNKMIRGELPKLERHPAVDGKYGRTITPFFTNLSNLHAPRRVTVLNKLFMKHISDLMATGEISSKILGHSIEITRVNITHDFRLIKVFWFSSNCNTVELIEISNILRGSAYKIRHELSRLKVIGIVPPIQFLEDKRLANMVELENKLLSADYGDDHTPMIKVGPLAQLTSPSTISNDTCDEIMILQTNTNNRDDEIHDMNLPPMRHDALGVDYSKIIWKIKQLLMKNEQISKKGMGNVSSIRTQWLSISTDNETSRSETDIDAFKTFLLSRRIAEKKRKKQSNDILDYDFIIDDTANGDHKSESELELDGVDVDNDTID